MGNRQRVQARPARDQSRGQRPWALLPLVAFMLAVAPATSALAQNEAESLSASFRKAARQVLPAVVTIRPNGPRAPGPGVPPLDSLVPRNLGIEISPLLPREQGGSGVVIDASKGYILTNDHVVARGSQTLVILADGRQRPAREVRRDPRSDLALVVVDPDGLQEAAWGDSESLEIGDWVLAIGQPFGLSGTVTAGIVSGKERGLGPSPFMEDLIQTDAAINPGSSGGPLVNLKGEVVGISIALNTFNGNFEGVGFVIPGARARRVAADLAERGHVRRSFVGVEIQPGDPEANRRLGHPGAVAITGVAPASPAAEAGLRPGDLVTAVAGKPVNGLGQLRSRIEFSPEGEPLALAILRNGEPLDVRVLPKARVDEPAPRPLPGLPGVPQIPGSRPVPDGPAQPLQEPEASDPTGFPDLGLKVQNPNRALVRRFGLAPDAKGLVIVAVEPGSRAERAGLEVGMMLTDVANHRVTSVDDLRSTLSEHGTDKDLVVRILKGTRAGFRVILADEAQTKEPPNTPTDSNPGAKPDPNF
jgi:serine protease Do